MTYVFYLFIVTALAAIDQYTKSLVVTYIGLNESIDLIKGFFSLTHVRNYGAGFSIMQHATLTFYIITPVCLGIFIYLLLKTVKNDYLSKAGLLLMIGGTIGNFIDRIINTYVIDFLDFIIIGWDFPVFNFADCCLTIGVFLYIIAVFLEYKNAKN
ncbi:MAG: signal peptidase II [Erysipelotrichaceae bacterium]|nr:signal peptidase II [Erysipelotrichaceae bacterium]